MTYDYEWFKNAVFQLTKIDLNAYKERQMKRRIDALITKHSIVGYDAYVQHLKTDKKMFEEFVNYLTINVSEFYRNPEQWQVMDKQIIPQLVSRFGKNLKVWSAACSTGDEPYSLVMALSRHLPLDMIHVVATDIDKQVIAKAKVGLYNEKSIAAVPEDFKKKYFTKVGLSYQISNEIKSKVEFKEHNLLESNFPKGYHMISAGMCLFISRKRLRTRCSGSFIIPLHQAGFFSLGVRNRLSIIGIWDLRGRIHFIMNTPEIL